MRQRILCLLPFAAIALVITLAPVPWSTRPITHYITMTADQFAFDPPVLRVKREDRVRLTLQAGDVVHGFYLDGYGLQQRVEPGISQEIEFGADRSGKFRFRCSVSCGPLHPFMIGELVVGPNLPFLRTVGLLLVAVTGTLVYLWRFPPRSV